MMTETADCSLCQKRDDCPFITTSKCFCSRYEPEAEQQKMTNQQTNGDKIRSMSDEVLAVYLEGCICPVTPCRYIESDAEPEKERCIRCWLDWLKQEVE